jgi:hypothetical protein
VIILATRCHPGHSALGIGWTAATAAATFALAAGKTRKGSALDSPVLITEGRVTLVDGILAVSVLGGLVLNAAVVLWCHHTGMRTRHDGPTRSRRWSSSSTPCARYGRSSCPVIDIGACGREMTLIDAVHSPGSELAEIVALRDTPSGAELYVKRLHSHLYQIPWSHNRMFLLRGLLKPVQVAPGGLKGVGSGW